MTTLLVFVLVLGASWKKNYKTSKPGKKAPFGPH